MYQPPVDLMHDRAYLLACAENEGGRAILAMQGYANAHTAAYFAREAIHYARLLRELDGPDVSDD